ncbi:MAG TPA: phosphate-starvation-inducible PsiE family protein [Anaerolineae bacterium]|nr:phosphate-starvation-inducible PsiE family protein [Anaerolineae bacterium]
MTQEEQNPERAGVRAGYLNTQLHRMLTVVEDLIYYAISAVLVVATAALLVSASIQWVSSLGVDLRAGTLALLDNVLLVMMLVEILSTISISLRQHVLAPQQFLIIGLIAAVRRMLVITAEQTELLHEPETFELLLWELLLLGVLVIVLSGAIYLLHKVPERSEVGRARGD